MTDNTKAKRKRIKEQTYKTFSRKLSIEQNIITKTSQFQLCEGIQCLESHLFNMSVVTYPNISPRKVVCHRCWHSSFALAVIAYQVELQLLIQSVYITNDVVSSISDNDEVNSIQHYVILCISDSSINKAYRQD